MLWVIVSLCVAQYLTRTFQNPKHQIHSWIQFLSNKFPNVVVPIKKTASRMPKLIRANSENLHMSGANLGERKFWVLVTASFSHENLAHLLNNMLMFIPYAGALEKITGGVVFLVLFLLTGICGWIGTLTYQKYHLHRDNWESAGQFSSSCGASPSTYGMGFLLACLAPYARVADTINLPTWFWISSIWIIPAFCSDKYGLNRPLYIAAGIPFLFLQGYILLDPFFPVIRAWQWFACFLLKTFAFRVYDYLVLGHKITNTDNMGHLTGAIAGFISTFFLTSSVPSHCTTVLMNICAYQIGNVCSFTYLVLRTLFNW
jgi:membrane associated rhomboid family serine protease